MLLVDTILNSNNGLMQKTLGLNQTALNAHLRKAQKFVLDRNFAAASDSVRDSEISKVIKHALPPFDTVWIEAGGADRTEFNKREAEPGTNKPQRVGILMVADLDNFRRYTATLFWRFNKGEFEIAPVAMRADLTDNWVPPTDFVMKSKETGEPLPPGSYQYRFVPHQSHFCRVPFPPRILDMGYNNWGGEIEFWSGALALLNCRNATVADAVERSDAVKKSSRKTLSDYFLCKIRLSAPMRQGEDSGNSRDVRAHFVRGHFKRRRSGLFWWSPYVRGDKSLGFIQKDYLVQP